MNRLERILFVVLIVLGSLLLGLGMDMIPRGGSFDPSSYFEMHGQVIGGGTPISPPYVVKSISDPIDAYTRNRLNLWLRQSAPSDAPYWFVTHWEYQGERMYISLVGADLSHPDEYWSLTGTPAKIKWFGSVYIEGDAVELFEP